MGKENNVGWLRRIGVTRTVNVGPLAKILNSKSDCEDTSRTQAWKSLFESGKLAQSEKKYDLANQFYQRAYAVYTQKDGGTVIVRAEILMQHAVLLAEMGDAVGARKMKSEARQFIAEFTNPA